MAALGAAARLVGSMAGRGGMAGRLNEKLWAADSAWNLASKVAGETLPQFQHACTVVVQGGPLADIRRVWFLCASVAFGRMLRSPAANFLSSATMQATWDITGKAAQIEIVYQANRLAALIPAARNLESTLTQVSVAGTLGLNTNGSWRNALNGRFRAGSGVTEDACGLIHQGPDQITVGSGWPNFLRRVGQFDIAVPGSSNNPVEGQTFRSQTAAVADRIRQIQVRPLDAFPRSAMREWPIGSRSGAAFLASALPIRLAVLDGVPFNGGSAAVPINRNGSPPLPDDGRLVTTGEKTNPNVQPPRPILDGATRTSLVSLVAASLATPCFLPDAPPITNTPLYNRGIFVHDNGAGNDYATVATLVQQQRTEFAPEAELGRRSDVSPDNIGTEFPAGTDTTSIDFRGS